MPVTTPKVSAIVLNWKRPEQVRKIVTYLSEKDYVDEVIVWNNNPVPLRLDQNLDKLRIINSEQNLGDHAKYLACAEARNEYCFYQDDDHNTKFFLDSMYFAFCLQPDRLHTLTDPVTWMSNWNWTYFNKEKDIHARFSWIGCGAFFARSLALRYLDILDRYFSPEEKLMADSGFAVLLNQPIIQMQVGLVKYDQDNAYSATPGFLRRQHEIQMKVGGLLDKFSCKENPLPRCVVRSVSLESILFTSFLPLDFSPRSIPFDPASENDLRRRTRDYIPMEKFKKFARNPYSFGLSPYQDRYWRAEFRQHDTWGIIVRRPCLIRLGTNNDVVLPEYGAWRVCVDDKIIECSTREIFTRSFDLQSTLCLTYLFDRDIELYINAKHDFH